MKNPSSYGTNTTTPAGRANGQFINDPGGDTGSGMVAEADNDNIYAVIAPIESWKEGGISDSDETTVDSDMRDATEELVSKKVSGISDWVIGTNYSAPGELSDLVMWKGFQFINISDVGNLGNNPLLFPKLWFKIPKVDKLMDQYFNGEPCSGGLSDLADRAGSKYLQNLLFGNYRLGGNGDDFYNFFRVALDGSIVTGNAILEAIFDVGGGSEYFNLDLIAPDVLGTRTLIDMGEHVLAAQSVSGENDTRGALQDDRAQGHWHEVYGTATTSTTASLGVDAAGIYSPVALANDDVRDPKTDGVNGTPRTGLTTRPKELTVGASYIVVMQAA